MARKQGRPTKYRKHMDVDIEKCLATGLSKEACSHEIGITKDTLYRWIKLHKSFSDSIRRGEIAGLAFWEKLGIQGALGRVPNFNAVTWIFNMKNRHKWRDRPEEESNVERVAEALTNLLDKMPD